MSAPSDGARADARKARLGKLVSSDWDSLADWLGAMDEARNVFDCTDEATTVINIDVEELAQRLAGVIADAKAEAWDEGWDVGRGIKEPACPDDHNPYREVTS